MHGCMRKAVILPDNLVSDLMIISQATTVDISTLTHTTESSLQTLWQYSCQQLKHSFSCQSSICQKNCRTTISVPAYLLSVQHSSTTHCVVCCQQ